MAGALRLEGSVRWPSSENPANMLSANAGAKTTTLCAYHASCEHDGTKLVGGSFLRPPPISAALAMIISRLQSGLNGTGGSDAPFWARRQWVGGKVDRRGNRPAYHRPNLWLDAATVHQPCGGIGAR